MFIYKKKNTFALASLAASASLAMALWSWTGKRASFLKTEKQHISQINLRIWGEDPNNLSIIRCLRWLRPSSISHGLPSSPRMKGHFQSNPITSASLLLLHFIHFSQPGDLEYLGIIIIKKRIKNVKYLLWCGNCLLILRYGAWKTNDKRTESRLSGA